MQTISGNLRNISVNHNLLFFITLMTFLLKNKQIPVQMRDFLFLFFWNLLNLNFSLWCKSKFSSNSRNCRFICHHSVRWTWAVNLWEGNGISLRDFGRKLCLESTFGNFRRRHFDFPDCAKNKTHYFSIVFKCSKLVTVISVSLQPLDIFCSSW